MSDENLPTQEKRWRRLEELPPDVFNTWTKKGGKLNPSSVVATVDEDGSPRTAPFGSLRAINPKLLRFLVHRYHDTLANCLRDPRVMVALISVPNIAVSVRGRARVVQNPWPPDERYALIEIDVEEVKNDMPVRIDIHTDISIVPDGPFQDWWESVWKHLDEK
ncbi:MAG: hypothetical protein EAX95_01915 [Candidatus Thorarchaeota archaeon]|nr:hypothetical protein [Candidatus Thorarchaeota archaeon]